MLAIGRKVGESVIIDGGLITVTVNAIDGKAALVTVDNPSGGCRFWLRLAEPVDIVRPDGGLFGSIVLTSVRGAYVRLGFTFRPDVAVDREEIFHLKNETRWSLTDGGNEQGEGRQGRTRVSGEDSRTVRRAS